MFDIAEKVRLSFCSGLVLLCLQGCNQRDAPTKPSSGRGGADFKGRTIELFVGSASKPATEEAAVLFEQRSGAKLVVHFGGSGQMLSQLKLTGRGDIYFPGSSDYMEMAKRESLIVPETERIVVYLIPAINVSKGNPKNLRGLEDLARSGVRVGIARPDAVCVGLYAAEVLEKAGLSDRVRPNIVTQTESCEKTAQLVALGHVDAVIGWDVFEHWQPEKIQTVFLPPERIPRIGYVPIAVAQQAADRELAEAFIEFLTGDEGQAVFRKWHYLTSESDARRHALPTTPVGGEFPIPEGWK
jgi:molybdate transport system substrate-binding protein